jgi:hypothetical protein
MMSEAPGSTEHAYNFEHQGDEQKSIAELRSAADRLAKDAFTVHGIVNALGNLFGDLKGMISGMHPVRGPLDFAERRRRPRYVRVTNGDEGGANRILIAVLVANVALLLILSVGVGVALYKLSNIEQGQGNGRTTRAN